MRRRRSDEAHHVEWIDVDATAPPGDEVDLTRTRSRRWSWIAPGALVVAVVGIAVTRGGDPVPSSSPTTTTSTTTTTIDATTTTVAAASSTAAEVTSTSSTTSPTTTIAPPLPLGVATNAVVYLYRGEGPAGFIAYDIDTGTIHLVPLYDGLGLFARTVDGGGGVYIDERRSVVHFTPTGPQSIAVRADPASVSDLSVELVAPGTRGGTWVRTFFDPPRLVLYDGAHPTSLTIDLPIGSDLYGSMADGRPVVRGADLRLFIIEPDGRRTLLTAAAASPVEAGRYIDTSCVGGERCSLVGHIDGKPVPLGPVGTGRYRFQPGGSLVAIVQGARGPDGRQMLALLDASTGRRWDAPILVGDGFISGLAAGAISPDVAFLPGGAGLVAVSGSSVILLRVTGEFAGSFVVPDVDGQVHLAGVGKAGAYPVG